MKIFRLISIIAFIAWAVQPSYVSLEVLILATLVDIFSSGRTFTGKAIVLGVLFLVLGFVCGATCDSTATDLTKYSQLAQALRICQLAAVGFICMSWKNLKLASKADYNLNTTSTVKRAPELTIHEGYEWATNSAKRQEVIEEVKSLLEDSDV